MNTTTRRFPRSMREAFPVDHAGCISGPHRPSRIEWMVIGAILACSLVGTIAWVFVS